MSDKRNFILFATATVLLFAFVMSLALLRQPEDDTDSVSELYGVTMRVVSATRSSCTLTFTQEGESGVKSLGASHTFQLYRWKGVWEALNMDVVENVDPKTGFHYGVTGTQEFHTLEIGGTTTAEYTWLTRLSPGYYRIQLSVAGFSDGTIERGDLLTAQFRIGLF